MKKNREERVLEFLRRYKTINPLEAWKICGTSRLSAVIFNLKKKGYKFKTEKIRVHTKFDWTYVAQYSLED